MATHHESKWLEAWYGKRRWTLFLWPLAVLYRLISVFRARLIKPHRLAVPVIVVGNITVGGTGKTPLLIALANHLKQQGYKPGIISRGYGGKAPHYPYLLTQDSTAEEAGDEPFAIYQRTHCLVAVGANRIASGELLTAKGCDILLSDDGLQHYRLARDIEIVVVDGVRGFGNRSAFPVGPLREPISRLAEVDFVVANSGTKDLQGINYITMDIQPVYWRDVMTGKQLALDEPTWFSTIHAVAGIGNPQRFFNTLKSLGVDFKAVEFPDHHHFSAQDFEAITGAVVMTEKDAVKCYDFAKPLWYALIIDAVLPESFWRDIDAKILLLKQAKKTFK